MEKIDRIDKNTQSEYLFELMSLLKTSEECKNFIKDLCTDNEIAALSQRLYVAKLLKERHVYNDIVSMTGASTATISRVNRSLSYGHGGYDVVFERSEGV